MAGEFTFLRINDITPILVSTCCRLSPSRGTPSAKVSALSLPGSHRCRINNEVYARKHFSLFPRRSRTNLWGNISHKDTLLSPSYLIPYSIQGMAVAELPPWNLDHINHSFLPQHTSLVIHFSLSTNHSTLFDTKMGLLLSSFCTLFPSKIWSFLFLKRT